MRLRRNVNADTPFPPEVPHAQNPPDGVIVDYCLAKASAREITLDVLEASGAVVRHLSSVSTVPVAEAARPPHPNFWVAPPQVLPAAAGENRTNWDLRYDAPPALVHSFEINANPGATPASPEGPVAVPGTYTLRLTVEGRAYSQPVTVRADPRSPATVAAVQAQHELQMKIVDGLKASFEGHRLALALQTALRGAVPAGAQPQPAQVLAPAAPVCAPLDTVLGLDASRRDRARGGPPRPSFTSVNNALVAQLNAQDQVDMAPTVAVQAAFPSPCPQLPTIAAAREPFICGY